jgi:hypothetical protein
MFAQEGMTDCRRFDDLTRVLASGFDRRTIVRGMLSLGGAALAGASLTGGAEAARRGYAGPTFPSPPTPCTGGLCGDPCESCAEDQACFENQCFTRCPQPSLDCSCGDCVILEGTGLELCATVIGGFCASTADCQQQHGAGWVCADNLQCLHTC